MKTNKFTDFLVIIFGLALVGFSVSVLIAPNSIVQGGVSGFSVIIYHLFDIPIAITNFIVNLLLIAIGIKVLGKSFIINTLICVVILSLFLQIFSYIPPITDNELLSALFGGLLYGIGICLTLLKGSSSGGTDILGRIFQHYFPNISIGKLLLLIDSVIILAGFIAFRNVELILFGIITLCVSTFSIDYLIKLMNVSKMIFIITDKGEEITNKLISTSGRGVTMINAVGAYTKTDKTLLMCAIKEREIPEFQKKVESIDESAFIIFCESQQIVGNGFYVYK